MKHRPRPSRPQRASQSQAFGTMTLGANSGRIVLLGLIAAEASARCKAERARVRAELDLRIATEEEHYPTADDSIWQARSASWRPVTCEITCPPTTSLGSIAAPVVTLTAERDGAPSIVVQYSICQRGLLRTSLPGWPAGAPKPIPPDEVEHLADAINWARRTVDRALPTLFAFSDPLRS